MTWHLKMLYCIFAEISQASFFGKINREVVIEKSARSFGNCASEKRWKSFKQKLAPIIFTSW